MLRILTYNVHGCRGADRRISTERIAAVIAAAHPQVVALQELDLGRQRSFGQDQARLIAEQLGMRFHFHPALQLAEERYGDAILSLLPLRLVKTGLLPGPGHRPGLEPRGALWVAVEVEGREVQIINTHLGLRAEERLQQVNALLGEDWLDHPDCRGRPVVLLGDLNSPASSRAYRRLLARLRDAQAGQQPRATFPARWPLLRLDHILLGGGMQALHTEVRRGPLERIASDHLPLLATLCLPSPPG